MLGRRIIVEGHEPSIIGVLPLSSSSWIGRPICSCHAVRTRHNAARVPLTRSPVSETCPLKRQAKGALHFPAGIGVRQSGDRLQEGCNRPRSIAVDTIYAKEV